MATISRDDFNTGTIDDEAWFYDTDEAQAPTVLDPGTYDAVVAQVTPETAQASGEPYLHFVFRITSPQAEGELIHDRRDFSLSKRAAWHTLRRLDQMLGRQFPRGKLRPRDLDVLVDVPVRLQLAVGEWNGLPRSEVKYVLPALDPAEPKSPPRAALF